MTTNLPAGRELDALVAEKVMGVVWDERRCRIDARYGRAALKAVKEEP